jgi:hypothetical protein
MEFNPTEIANKETQILFNDIAKSVNPEVQDIGVNIRDSYTKTDLSTFMPKDYNPKNDYAFRQSVATAVKPTLETRNYNVGEAYAKLNDGSYIAKYDTFRAGRDNAEYFAQTQSTSDKWLNGVTKFAGQFATGVVGGTVGTVYGITQGIKEGSFRATYDNDFLNYLDDLNEKWDYQLPNYYSKAEKEEGFFGSLGSANFWAKDVLGGAAFTVSAIASEAIWGWATGGVSLATTATRLGLRAERLFGKGSMALNAINKAKDVTLSPVRAAFTKLGKAETLVNATMPVAAATNFGKAGAMANAARFMYTSAGYESGFEARSYIREQRESFDQKFESKNGRPATSEEKQDFEENLTNSANALYGANLAIVGTSNLAVMGKIMDIKNPMTSPTRWVNSKIFGAGVRSTESGLEKIATSKAQKIGQYAWSLSKGPLTEGVWEEGMQSVSSNTAKNWIDAKYDPKYTKDTLSLTEAFNEGLSQTYGTKEGMKEVGVGMLIGLITGTGIGVASGKGINSEFYDVNKRTEGLESLSKYYAPKKMAENFAYANRVQLANESYESANAKGDIVGGELARKSSALAQLNYAYNLDYFDQTINDTEIAIRNIDNETIMKEHGVDEKGAQTLKDSMVQEYKDTAKTYKKYRDFSEYFVSNNLNKEKELLGDHNADSVREAIAYELTLGESVHNFSGDLLQAIKEKVGTTILGTDISNALNIEDILLKAGKETKVEATNKEKQAKVIAREIEALDNEYLNLEATFNNTRTDEEKKAFLSKMDSNRAKKTKLEKERETLTSEYNALLSSAKLKNPFGKNGDEVFISSRTLEDRVKKVNNINEIIKAHKTVDPQEALQLEKLVKEYSKSVYAFQRYAELSRQLSDPELGLRGKRNIISEIMSEKSPNKATAETLEKLMAGYDERLGQNLEDVISRQEDVEKVIKKDKKKKGATIDKLTEEEKNKKKQAEIQKVNQEYDAKANKKNSGGEDQPGKVINGEFIPENLGEQIFESINAGITRVDDFSKLSKEEKDKLKSELREQIEKLPEDYFFLTHLTASDITLEGILNTGLNTGPAAESTSNVSTTKEDLYSAIESLIDGKINHRDSTKLAIIGFPNSINTQNLNIKNYFGDIVFEHIMSVSPNDAGIRIPSSFNVATFSNGRLSLVGEVNKTKPNKDTQAIEKERQAKLDAIEKKYAPKEDKVVREEAPKKSIRDTVVEMIKNSPYLLDYFGEGVPVLPTQEELDEYTDLANRAINDPKIDNDTVAYKNPYSYNRLTPTTRPSLKKAEVARLQELNNKMSKWGLLGAYSNAGGVSIKDMLLQDIAVNQSVDPIITSEVTEDELVTNSNVEPKQTDKGEGVRNEEVLQVYQDVFIKRNQTGTTISHLSLPGLLSRMDIADSIGYAQISVEKGKQVIKKGSTKTIDISQVVDNLVPGANFVVTFPNGETATISVKRSGALLISKSEDFTKVFDAAGLRYVDNTLTNKAGFSPVYDQETGKKLNTDYTDTSEYSPMELYNMIPGNSVTFSINLASEYNQKLIADYLAATPEQEEEASRELASNLKINVIDIKGRKLGDLKANYETNEGSEFLLLREEAAKLAKDKEADISDIDIRLSKESFIKHIFLGVPNFVFENGEVKYFDITPDAVVDYGYVQDGKVSLKGNTKNVRMDYVKDLLKKEGLPIAVFKQGQYLVAFPMNLKEGDTKIGDKALETLMQSDSLGKGVLELNNTLANNGISPSKYNLFYLSEDNQSLFTEDKMTSSLEEAINKLNEVRQVADVTEWMSPDHTKENLVDQASIAIDITNNPLTSPKPIINLNRMVDFKDDWYAEALRTGELSDEKAIEIATKIFSGDSITPKESNFVDDPKVVGVISQLTKLEDDLDNASRDAQNEPC